MLEINKIYCMDCIKGMQLLPDNSIDLVLTDPPYNTGMTMKNGGGRLSGFFNDNYNNDEYNHLVKKSCIEFYRLLKNDRACYIFINWKSLSVWLENLEKAGFNIKNVIVWDKIVHGLNYQNYAYTYELIIFAIKGKFVLKNKTRRDLRNGFYKDVWHIQRNVDSRSINEFHHETEKKLDVVRLPILHATNEGDLVLDSFMGSGTTAVACKQTRRRYIGFEKLQRYVDFANNRLKQENLNDWIGDTNEGI